MEALILNSIKEPLQVQKVDDPKCSAEEVVVKIAGCGVCHTDIGFWIDGVPTKKEFPLILGHEISGTVIGAGSEFRHLIDQEVIIPAVIPCAACDLCTNGRANICRNQIMPGNDIDGGFAEYISVPGRGLCLIGDRGGYELAELSVVADAVTTPYQAVVRSKLKEGELAIVIGVGGVGGYCAQIASAFGARVIAIDIDDMKLDAIHRFGADLTINSQTYDFKEIKNQIYHNVEQWALATHRWKIFECSGSPIGQQLAFGLITFASTLMVIGFTMAKVDIRLSNLMAFDASVQGTWGCKPDLYPEALKLVTDGKISLKPFIETFPMSAGPDVLQRVANHEMGKRAILVPDWQVKKEQRC